MFYHNVKRENYAFSLETTMDIDVKTALLNINHSVGSFRAICRNSKQLRYYQVSYSLTYFSFINLTQILTQVK